MLLDMGGSVLKLASVFMTTIAIVRTICVFVCMTL